jgi:hypothetical protein
LARVATTVRSSLYNAGSRGERSLKLCHCGGAIISLAFWNAIIPQNDSSRQSFRKSNDLTPSKSNLVFAKRHPTGVKQPDRSPTDYFPRDRSPESRVATRVIRTAIVARSAGKMRNPPRLL